MEINRYWLEEELLSSNFYHGYELDWLSNQEEADVYRLVEKLLTSDIMESFDNQYDHNGHYSASLAFANWLLIRTLDDKQLLRYVLAAVEQILPLVRDDFPDDNTSHSLIALTKTYLRVIPEMPLKNKFIYRNLILELIEFSCNNIDYTLDAKLSWSIYAAHLAAYTAIYSTFKSLHSYNKLPLNCATHAVTFSACYLSTKKERNAMLKKSIEYGLSLVNEITVTFEPEIILQGVN